jgi:uncharacterized protein YxeA
MKTPLIISCCVVLLVTTSAIALNVHNSQKSSVSINEENNMRRTTTFTSQQSSYSSGYQKSILNLDAVNLNQPHILSINTSGNQLNGQITVNGKLIKQINSNQIQMNLSPYLSVGQHTVEVTANYTPPSSAISVEIYGPGVSVTQQTNGSGTLNYTLSVTVE